MVMPYCPNCKTEYRKGYDICADCGKSLVEELPADVEEEYIECMVPVKLISVANYVEAGIVVGMLEENKIQTLVKSPFAGSLMNIRCGSSVYGEDIYVDESDLERALEIIEVLKRGE